MKKFAALLLLVIGVSTGASIAHARDGDLDISWGGTGVVTFASGAQTVASVTKAYGTDKVMVAGITGVSSNSIDSSFVARYLDDGSLDTTCAGSGYASYRGPSDFLASDMAILADGSIVLVGHDTAAAPVGKVIKFDSSCQLDTTFGVAGIVDHTERQGIILNAVSLGPNGTLVVGGHAAFAPVDGGDSRPFVMRLNADGSFDTTFGDSSTGRWVASANHEGYINDLVVHDDGKITFAGVQFDATENQMVGRLTAAGAVDTTFATSGWYVPVAPDAERSQSIARRVDGGFVIVGSDHPEVGTNLTNMDGSVLCLTSGGQPDPVCGGTGRRTFSVDADDDAFWDVDVDDQNRILIAGYAKRATTSFTDPTPLVMRLLPSLAVDPSFGSNGILVPPIASGNLSSIERDGRGRILTSGFAYTAGGGDAKILRLDSTNAPTTTTAPTTTAPIPTVAPQLLPATGPSGPNMALTSLFFALIGLAILRIRHRHEVA